MRIKGVLGIIVGRASEGAEQSKSTLINDNRRGELCINWTQTENEK